MEIKAKQPLLLFDFDGTIADTYDFVYDIAEDLVKDFGLGEITPEMMSRSRDLPLRSALKKLGFNSFTLLLASKRFQKYLYERLDQLKPVKGIDDILMQLSQKYRLGMLSFNGPLIIKTFLKEYNLNYFDFVSRSFFLGGKHIQMRRIMRRNKLQRSELIYFGDEVSDIIASKKAGIRSVAVTWGYNTEKALKSAEPEYLIHKPGDILKLNFRNNA